MVPCNLRSVFFSINWSSNKHRNQYLNIGRTILVFKNIKKLNLFFSSPDGREGTCLGELTVPALWWPSMTHSVGSDLTKTASKQPKVNVKVAYSVFETKGHNCQSEQGKILQFYLKVFLSK